MTEQSAWSFADDRGRLAVADRRPSRVLAYAQAGATLWDYGIRPEGIFGSGHDGAEPDRAKTGTLPLDSVDYRGAGDDLDVDTLLRGRPDLVVAVSYGHGQLYGLDPDTAKHLEESVPVVVIDVGQVRTLDRVAERFAELARSLGGAPVADAADELHAARERLRAAVRTAPGSPRVLALSPALPGEGVRRPPPDVARAAGPGRAGCRPGVPARRSGRQLGHRRLGGRGGPGARRSPGGHPVQRRPARRGGSTGLGGRPGVTRGPCRGIRSPCAVRRPTRASSSSWPTPWRRRAAEHRARRARRRCPAPYGRPRIARAAALGEAGPEPGREIPRTSRSTDATGQAPVVPSRGLP